MAPGAIAFNGNGCHFSLRGSGGGGGGEKAGTSIRAKRKKKRGNDGKKETSGLRPTPTFFLL